jgi:arylsulfatase A-like enzyme
LHGQILDAIDKAGIRDNTIVIFTSDNGGRYEREALKAGHRTNGELLGQKTDGWEGGHRVPLMARWPEHIQPGTVRKEFFLQVDLMATLADAAQITLPAGASPDGASELAAFTKPASAPAKRTEGVMLGSGTYVLRQGDWLYIPKQGSAGYTAPERDKPWSVPYALMGFKNSDVDEHGQIKPGAPKEQLYDLSKDLAQAKNIAREHPERVASMRTRLEELTGKSKTKTPTQ